MKKWMEADVAVLSVTETFGNGNTAGGPDGGGVGNGKKLNQRWTEDQKDGNTTFWGGSTDPQNYGGSYVTDDPSVG